jgi:ABC-2 type transport system ATP-binding protein
MSGVLLSLSHLNKRYGSYIAGNDISVDISKGRIFGLLGPNGAGKTTLIRMITRITLPDSGHILFNGEPLKESHMARIGYMPEERGLYKKMKVLEQLLYLGRLKGLSRHDALQKIKYWLQKFEIESWAHKTIDELSKGMSQKVQFIATILHEPDLLILDEPFSGLDPINSRLIEEEIHTLSANGKTIIFSTHRMEQVEEICNTIMLVNKGVKILEGDVHELKQRFKEQKFLIRFSGPLPESFAAAFNVVSRGEQEAIVHHAAEDHNAILRFLVQHNVSISEFKEILPGIGDIFIQSVQSAAI